MKTFIKVLIMYFVLTGSLQAQTVRGSKVIGGGILYQNEKVVDYESETKNVDFSLIPSIGYFVVDNLSVGINLGLSTSMTETTYTGFNNVIGTKGSIFSVGPFVRYYKHTSNENFAIYGQFSALFGSGKEEVTNGDVDNKVKNSSLDIALSPGLVYFLNNHWAVEMGFTGIGYSKSDPNKDADKDQTTSLVLGLNSFLPSNIGFRFHF